LSVGVTTGLSLGELWRLGDDIGIPRDQPAIAVRDFTPLTIEACAEAWPLCVVHDVPPRRHALILGWPEVENTEARKNVAMSLDRVASTRRRFAD
jgi:hypothetical protein